MGITLENINENERVEYRGDVRVTGNIGSGAVIIIHDGSLIVDGSVGDDAQIKVSLQPTIISSNAVIFNHFTNKQNIIIKRGIGNNVNITADNADINIPVSIGRHCRVGTYNGSIYANTAMQGSDLESYNGSIVVNWEVESNVSLTTYNGTICAGNLAEHTKASTYNGNIKVQNAPDTAQLSSTNGDVYVGGVKRKRAEKNNAYSMFVSTGNSRVFVNGVEITQQVRNAQDNSQNNAPIKSRAGTITGAAVGTLALGWGIGLSLAFLITLPALPFALIVAGASLLGLLVGGLIGDAIDKQRAQTSTGTTITHTDIMVTGGSSTPLQRTFSKGPKVTVTHTAEPEPAKQASDSAQPLLHDNTHEERLLPRPT